MKRTHTMTAAGVSLAGLGLLAGLAVGSGQSTPATVASRTQPVEVRTEVIRKTVHVYRRARPHRAVGGFGGGAAPGARGSSASVLAGAAPRTRSSGAHTAVGGAPASAPVSAPATVRTRTSGSRSGPAAPPRSSAPARRPVRTASSGTNSASGRRPSSGGAHHVSPAIPVRTRTSGAASHPSTGTSKPIKTRSSGHGEGKDGGKDGGKHDD